MDVDISNKKKRFEAGMKKLLAAPKEAKICTVVNSTDKPSERIVLLLRRRGTSESENSLVAWAELTERDTNKLIRDLALRLRYMKRKETEE